MAAGVAAPWDPGAFDDLAHRVYVAQYAHNPVYRALCDARSATPDRVGDWRHAPLVPARAFRSLDLVCVEPASVALVFLTSGTTGGSESRGRHFVPWPELYRSSLLPTFRAYVLPEGGRPHLISLIPSPTAVPDSSLSHMMGVVAAELCATATWCVQGEGALKLEDFLTAARAAEADDRAVLVAGTAFAFVHLLDRLERDGSSISLPEGSRIMETGGFKGRARSVVRTELYGAMAKRLGVPARRVVNEYGMTELLSQLYEPVLLEGPSSPRRHVPPPWLRVHALDPVTLEPLPEGREGLLSFFDLANLGSVSHILTEDLGSVTEDGVYLRGRAPRAEARGCSLAMDELMSLWEGA